MTRNTFPKKSPKKSPERAKGRVHGVSSLSLQEAFLQRKMDFIEQSHERMQQLKANAAKRQCASAMGVFGRSQQGWRTKGRQTTSVSTNPGDPASTARRGVAKSVTKNSVKGMKGMASPTKQSMTFSPSRQTTRTGGVASPKGKGVSKSPGGSVRRSTTTHSAAVMWEHGSSNVVQPQPVYRQDYGKYCICLLEARIGQR